MTNTPNDWTDNDLEQLSRIAPNAGAPSERAGKIREEIAEILSNYMDVPACQPDKFNEMVQRLDRLLDAECKAAVARRDEEWELAKQIIYADAERQVKAEEERAFKEREELRSTHLVHQFDEAFKTTREHAREICKLLGLADSENWLYVRHEVSNYALREADARIARLIINQLSCCPCYGNLCSYCMDSKLLIRELRIEHYYKSKYENGKLVDCCALCGCDFRNEIHRPN